MPETVVHMLEMIEIEMQHRTALINALAPREKLRQDIIEKPPIGQPGQWIMKRPMLHLGVDLFQAAMTALKDGARSFLRRNVAHRDDRAAIRSRAPNDSIGPPCRAAALESDGVRRAGALSVS